MIYSCWKTSCSKNVYTTNIYMQRQTQLTEGQLSGYRNSRWPNCIHKPPVSRCNATCTTLLCRVCRYLTTTFLNKVCRNVHQRYRVEFAVITTQSTERGQQQGACDHHNTTTHHEFTVSKKDTQRMTYQDQSGKSSKRATDGQICQQY